MNAPRFNPMHLAGWLFADLLLVLALVAMGDRGDPLAAAARPSASPSAEPAPAKSRKPTGPRAVQQKPVKVSITAAPGDRRRIEQRLRAVTAPYKGRQAAFVLTFGRHADPGAGGAYAHEVNSLLKKARPGMFEDTTTRDFWKGGASSGHADLEIYFYTY
ncbi:hypothetical protein [Streptomyces nitrosporeus]|uniref:Uncharacterized protein n=1 Tax=Streptomyces nitrosporeus TaxID=28894 RepID=A0A5J6FGT1_9ACTN|nr:hypothetical protein [Streptomyces nitrosporeus]QEU74135.1 hypothetical protein CP967_20955 [Streptomyces nitrosporeus]GGZ26302.1 hypothetical protein GCM10010327_66130 [Streptomyces nitrosporeus]